MRRFATTATIPLCTASSAEGTTILRRLPIALLLLTVVLVGNTSAQSWTPVAAPWLGTNAGPYHALLLTDGTVMVQEGYYCCASTSNWWRLTPDQYGSYINGKWSQLASMPIIGGIQYCPAAYASAVLPDGRVIVEGGEYNCEGSNHTTLGAIFDPTVNPPMGQWTPVSPPANWLTIGDAPSVVLPEAPYMDFMLGNCCTHDPTLNDAYLDPVSLTWTSTGLFQYQYNNEHGWELLPPMMDSPAGSVLVVNGLLPITDGRTSERYLPPPLGFWIPAGSTIVSLWDCDFSQGLGCEIGPAVLRPDGTVFAEGASFNTTVPGNTAFYHTSQSDPDYATWTAGPVFPCTGPPSKPCLSATDAPASLLPNGNVLVAAGPAEDTPTNFFEFTLAASYGGGSFVSVPSPPNAVNDEPYNTQLLLLPTGQVMFTDGSTDVEIYTPANQNYNPAWAPRIANVGGQFVRTTHTNKWSGRQFNGMSQATMFGDDSQMATNYPLVRLIYPNPFGGRDDVDYCRTHDPSSMGVATGGLLVTVEFDCPGAAQDAAILEIVANGIPSIPVWVEVIP